MTALTLIQVMDYAYLAGWRGNDLAVAGAVAMAESRGKTDDHYVTPKEDSRGLWQINVLPTAHPEYANVNLFDPAINAQAAHTIWAKSGWGQWTTHTSGKYLVWYPAALAAVPGTTGAVGTQQAITSAVGGITSTTQQLSAWLDFLSKPEAWIRVTKVVVGISLVVGGLYLITRLQVLEPAGAKVAGAVTGGGGKLGTAVKAAKGAKSAPTTGGAQ